MFSPEYLKALAAKTGFQTESLQIEMFLIVILREIQRHRIRFDRKLVKWDHLTMCSNSATLRKSNVCLR